MKNKRGYQTNLNDITITFVRKGRPMKLLAWLKENDFTVTQEYKGIYYVSRKHVFPVQIIVTKELSKERQKWLTLLVDGLSEEDARRAVLQANELEEKGEKDYADSVLQVVVKANKNLFHLLKEEEIMCQALRELMAEEIKAERAAERAEGRAEGALQNMILLVKKNLLSVEIAANELGMSVEDFTKKMNTIEG